MPKQLPATAIKKRFSGYRHIVLTTLIPALALLFIAALNRSASQAPEVTFITLTGQKIALKALRGKPVIITFWATDCPGCIKEMPHLINLYNQYRNFSLVTGKTKDSG